MQFTLEQYPDAIAQVLNSRHKVMQFTLERYPDAIAQAAQAVNQIDYRIGEIKRHLEKIEGNADIVTAFAVDLKNDHQRKARRFEILQASDDFQNHEKALLRLTADRSNAAATLEQLRHGLSVSMLLSQIQLADRQCPSPHRSND